MSSVVLRLLFFLERTTILIPLRLVAQKELRFERTFRNLQNPVNSLLLPSECPYPVPAFPAEDWKQEQKPTLTFRNRSLYCYNPKTNVSHNLWADRSTYHNVNVNHNSHPPPLHPSDVMIIDIDIFNFFRTHPSVLLNQSDESPLDLSSVSFQVQVQVWDTGGRPLSQQRRINIRGSRFVSGSAVCSV